MTITDTDRLAVQGVTNALRDLNDAIDFLSAQGIRMPAFSMMESFGILNDRIVLVEPFVKEEIIR